MNANFAAVDTTKMRLNKQIALNVPQTHQQNPKEAIVEMNAQTDVESVKERWPCAIVMQTASSLRRQMDTHVSVRQDTMEMVVIAIAQIIA
jgi:hypothetical protein